MHSLIHVSMTREKGKSGLSAEIMLLSATLAINHHISIALVVNTSRVHAKLIRSLRSDDQLKWTLQMCRKHYSSAEMYLGRIIVYRVDAYVLLHNT
jgi:hypothetical protein